MKKPRGDAFNERQQNAAKAKQALIEKLKARPAADDPAVLKRQAERKAIAEAREQRAIERTAAKEKEEQDRIQQEEEDRKAVEMRQARELEEAADLMAAQKAARDAKYAARKARGRK